MVPPPDSPSINIKVSWLKQNLAAGTSQPVLEFDEQQLFHFDPHQTTFRMVKHSCSYPAPPHKVRMWCSSFGAATELPLSMELNVFINTFELITEEKHTLAMAHLTGGETVAFEMVQGDQFSELSRFLLGNNLGRTGKQGAAAAAAAMAAGAALPMLLPGSCGPSPGLLEPLAQMRRSAGDARPGLLGEATLVTGLTRAEAASAKMAAELIAEEEEEKARREKKKAKKKGKKEKQKEKRKGPSGDAPSAAADASLDASDEDGEEEAEAEAGAAGGGALTGEKERGAVAGAAGGRQGDSIRLGACTAAAASRVVGEAGAPARNSKAAAARVTAPAAGSTPDKGGYGAGSTPDKGGYGAGSLSSLAGACGGVSASACLASVLIREAGAGTASAAAGIAANAAQLEAHVQKCHALIRALVDACMSERQRKQALTDQLHNFEQAAAAQHAEYSADVQRLQARLDELEGQNLEYARMAGAR